MEQKYGKVPGTTTKNIEIEGICGKEFQLEFKTRRYHGRYDGLNMVCFPI